MIPWFREIQFETIFLFIRGNLQLCELACLASESVIYLFFRTDRFSKFFFFFSFLSHPSITDSRHNTAGHQIAVPRVSPIRVDCIFTHKLACSRRTLVRAFFFRARSLCYFPVSTTWESGTGYSQLWDVNVRKYVLLVSISLSFWY